MARSRRLRTAAIGAATLTVLTTILGAQGASGEAQGAKGDALRDALNDTAAAFWVYDDLPAAEKMAKKSGKPLLITLRCVP